MKLGDGIWLINGKNLTAFSNKEEENYAKSDVPFELETALRLHGAPVYSACKAALHSYTMVLRHSLSQTHVRVVELVPPAVQTGLAGSNQQHGASLEEFCDSVFPQLFQEEMITVEFGLTARLTPELSGKPVSEYFEASAQRFAIEKY